MGNTRAWHTVSRNIAAGLLAGLLATAAQAAQTLRVLAWPGYAEPEQVQLFEKKYGVSVSVSYVSSDDELWQRASRNDGENFDVLAVNTAELQRLIDRQLVMPIRVANIPNLKKQLPRYRNIAALNRDGKRYAVPYTHGEMGLIYNRKLVKTPPASIAELWNPKYKGKVLAFDGSAHNFSIAAQEMGLADPFNLNRQDMMRAVNRLIALRRNVYTFYKTPEEAADLFRETPIALVYANYGEQQVALLKKAGADIGYVVPKEGALAWLDCWAILRGAKDPALAEAWINFTLDREMSEQLISGQGLANTLQESGSVEPSDKLIWLEPVEDPGERALLWSRILSGHRKPH
ncbi:extracellular solute-binding protein [Chitinilyticum litopenaei]|uniref:extracellular solute-binding protein n=1 Tax=Chitinilyticum litopenaei TaxID=1121276 RepID=UPI000411B035|nr:extracellular solute-binding protein [Chitinilyticum litopenaei]